MYLQDVTLSNMNQTLNQSTTVDHPFVLALRKVQHFMDLKGVLNGRKTEGGLLLSSHCHKMPFV